MATGAAVASVPKLAKPPRYYHELDPTYFSVTSNTFIGEVYGLFGLRNIADTTEGTTDYPQLSEEFIISQSPDLIFLADSKCCGESRDSVAQRPGWAATSAVSTGSVFIIDDDVASRWGPRVVDYVELVADAMAYVADLSAG
jgi:iron complex transport system substrate-binding protein